MSSSTSTFISTVPALSRACSSDSVDSAAPRTPPAVDSHPRIFSPDNTSLPLVEGFTGKAPEHQLLLPLHPQRRSQSPDDSEREFLAEFNSINLKERSTIRSPPRRSPFTNLSVGVYNLLLLLYNIKDYAMQAVAVAQLAYHGATIIFKMKKGVYKPSDTLSGWLLEAFCSLLAVFIWRFAVFMRPPESPMRGRIPRLPFRGAVIRPKLGGLGGSLHLTSDFSGALRAQAKIRFYNWELSDFYIYESFRLSLPLSRASEEMGEGYRSV